MAFALAALVLLVMHQHLIDLAALGQHATGQGRNGVPLPPSFYLALPYRVIDPMFLPPHAMQFALIALAAVESAVLYGLYRSLRDRTTAVWERVALAAIALAMLALALGARSVLGFDLYAYAGYAKLGVPAVYAGPPVPFAGDFRAVSDVWGWPISTCPYGPLWVALAQRAAGGATSLASALLALRLLAAGGFAAIVALLAWRRGVAFAALFGLNPALDVLYVANGHNDLLAVAPLLLAIALAGSLPFAAALLAAAAALIKLPFAAGVLLVFAGRGGLARRAAWAGLSFALIAAGSLLWGGSDYVHYLLHRVHEYHATNTLSAVTASVIRLGLFALAVVAVLAAFVRGTIWRAASWSLIASSSTVYPWYLATALPYAVLEGGALAAFLVLVPLAAALLEFAFPHLGLGQLTMLVMLGAGIVEIVRKRARPLDDQTVRPGP